MPSLYFLHILSAGTYIVIFIFLRSYVLLLPPSATKKKFHPD